MFQFDQRTKIGPEARQQLLGDLDFQRERQDQDEEEYSQFVFQGQCLILGDSRVGKTSLVKSLTGQPFDSEEPSTKGVQTSWVDRKWQNLNADTDLKFGSLARFYKSVRVVIALLESRGCSMSILWDQELSSILSPAFKIISLCWIISVICLWVFAIPSVGFYIFSFLALVAAVVLSYILRVFNVFSRSHEIQAGFFISGICPTSIVGLVGVMLLLGYLHIQRDDERICCFDVVFSFIRLCTFKQVLVWCFHVTVLLKVLVLTAIDIITFLVEKYIVTMKSIDGSSIRNIGQLISDFTIPDVVTVVFTCIYWIAMYFLKRSSRATLEMSKAIHNICQFNHITVILFSGLLMYLFIRTLCRVTNIMKGIVSPILFIFVMESMPDCFTSFSLTKSYRLMYYIGIAYQPVIFICIGRYLVKLVCYKSALISVRAEQI